MFLKSRNLQIFKDLIRPILDYKLQSSLIVMAVDIVQITYFEKLKSLLHKYRYML